MHTVEDLRKLTEECAQANYAYHVLDKPIMSDLEYNMLCEELRQMEEEVGIIWSNSPTLCRQGVQREERVRAELPKKLSYEAVVKTTEEISKFIGEHTVQMSWRLNGPMILVAYEKGKMIRAVTRGDGIQGEDITDMFMHCTNVPLKLAREINLVVKGNLIVRTQDFNDYNANRRKADKALSEHEFSASVLRSMSLSMPYERKMRFVATDIFECEDEELSMPIGELSKEEQLQYLESLHLEVIGHVDWIMASTFEAQLQKFKDAAPDYQYPTLGVVFSHEDCYYGNTFRITSAYDYRYILLRWDTSSVETKFRGMEYDISRQGRIIMSAKFTPVTIGGVTFRRAQIFNCEDYESWHFGMNDKILVSKPGQFLPRIDENLTQSGSYQLITRCPYCDSRLVRRPTLNNRTTTFLYCENESCEEVLVKRIMHFCSRDAMDMPGIARQTIKLLIDNKMLSCMDDLYRLRDREKELRKIDRMGAISTRVLLETIEKSRICHMWRFLNGLGIPQVGKLIARKLDWYYKGDFFAFYTDAKEGKDFSHIKGVTDRDSDIIHRWCVTPHKAVNVERMMYYMTFITEDFDPEEMKQAHPTSPFYGKNVVLAGTYTKLSNEEITNQLMKAGAKVRAVIGSTTDFLLAGDHSGTKRARAAELEIPILYEDEFIRMIGDLT